MSHFFPEENFELKLFGDFMVPIIWTMSVTTIFVNEQNRHSGVEVISGSFFKILPGHKFRIDASQGFYGPVF